MTGVARNIKRSGLSRRDVKKMYAETIELRRRGRTQSRRKSRDRARGNKSSRVTDTSQEKDNEDDASQEDSSKRRQEL